ncbi:MAG TPA: PaaI family thioesterase [Streptosporangiaceae bacterium]|nr:PaaI family thioesterase [Streptosporangiaceae bacterium]
MSTSARAPRILDRATEQRIREGIRRQTLLTTLGISIAELAVGRVMLDLPYRADLCQQNGYVHAGAITALADSACGYAAASLMPEDRDVLTVEFKINLLAPARGDRFRATGEVIRAGRTLTVCSAEVVAWADDIAGNPEVSLVRVALMQATMMAVTPPAS